MEGPMNQRTHILLAGIAGATAVIAGAMMAHRVPNYPGSPQSVAVLYHMFHALALLGVAALAARNGTKALTASAWCFAIGILLFSGGIYLRAIFGPSFPGATVPVGGMAFIAGWLALVWHALSRAE